MLVDTKWRLVALINDEYRLRVKLRGYHRVYHYHLCRGEIVERQAATRRIRFLGRHCSVGNRVGKTAIKHIGPSCIIVEHHDQLIGRVPVIIGVVKSKHEFINLIHHCQAQSGLKFKLTDRHSVLQVFKPAPWTMIALVISWWAFSPSANDLSGQPNTIGRNFQEWGGAFANIASDDRFLVE